MIKFDKKIATKQTDLTVFVLESQGAGTPFAPPGYAGDLGVDWILFAQLVTNIAVS